MLEVGAAVCGVAAVRGNVAEIHHQTVCGFDAFADFVGACPQGVFFFVLRFVCCGSGLNQQLAAGAVDSEVFELGLGFEGFGIVNVQLGAAADGAENVDIDKNRCRDKFDTA